LNMRSALILGTMTALTVNVKGEDRLLWDDVGDND